MAVSSWKDITLYPRSITDLRIRVSRPNTGYFVLGQSTLNGTDVLGDSYAWDTYQNEIVEVVYEVNNDVTSGLFTRPVANTASILIKSSALNPITNVNIHPNTKVRLEWRYSSGAWSALLTGFIENVSTIYNQNAGTLVRMDIIDPMQRFLNAKISFSRAAGDMQSCIDAFIPAAITAANLQDAVFTPVSYLTFGLVSNHGALAYTDVTVGQILNDLMDAELGVAKWSDLTLAISGRDFGKNASSGWRGKTKKMDSWEFGYNADYLSSTIVASLTSAPTTYYSKQNTDVSSFFGEITQTATVNLRDAAELGAWMTSITQFSPGIRCLNFSAPYFIPIGKNELINVVNDYIGETSNDVNQVVVNATIYFDATSVSTQMTLWQPV